MPKYSKRQQTSIRVFIALSFIVIIIGVIMRVTHQSTKGIVGRGSTTLTTYDGKAVIIVGIIMLFLIGGLVFFDKYKD